MATFCLLHHRPPHLKGTDCNNCAYIRKSEYCIASPTAFCKFEEQASQCNFPTCHWLDFMMCLFFVVLGILCCAFLLGRASVQFVQCAFCSACTVPAHAGLSQSKTSPNKGEMHVSYGQSQRRVSLMLILLSQSIITPLGK